MFYLLFSVEICNTLENLTYVPKSFQGTFTELPLNIIVGNLFSEAFR